MPMHTYLVNHTATHYQIVYCIIIVIITIIMIIIIISIVIVISIIIIIAIVEVHKRTKRET